VASVQAWGRWRPTLQETLPHMVSDFGAKARVASRRELSAAGLLVRFSRRVSNCGPE